MERKYRAFYNDGHDRGEFEYYSSHRNYSKKNMEDLENTFKRKFGYSRFEEVKKYGDLEFGYLTQGY